MKPSNLLFPNLVGKLEERTGAFLTGYEGQDEPPCFPQQTEATKSNQNLPVPSRPWGHSSVPMASPTAPPCSVRKGKDGNHPQRTFLSR